LGGFHDQIGFVLDQSRHVSANSSLPEVLQLAQSGRVKCSGLDPVGPEISKPRPHFGSSSGGKGHRQHVIGVIHSGRDTVGDAVSNGTGLSGSGTS